MRWSTNDKTLGRGAWGEVRIGVYQGQGSIQWGGGGGGGSKLPPQKNSNCNTNWPYLSVKIYLE